MKYTSNCNLICACEKCRQVKKLTFSIGGDDITSPIKFYELRQHKISKEYKYFPLETCDYCGKGYIIKTKLFDRCVRCGKDASHEI